MKLRVHERLPGLHPLHAWHRWRDELVHRAARIPKVRGLRERERADGSRLLEGAVDVEIPLMARAFVPRDALVVELLEQWDEERVGCVWILRSRGFSAEAASAAGELTFRDDGLLVEGEVRVDLCALPQLPSGLAKSAGPGLEQLLARQIEAGYRLLARTLL
ncbi:hypothetical protein [Vulgatibacter sp.]|uniref:hypothetical protein n=1 Tax=Vulgatibacter sp. TaxID=1971226 RepID=UPI003562B282